MARLGDIAKACKSKNAGPFELTLDIMFGDAATFEKVRATGVINAALIAKLPDGFALSVSQAGTDDAASIAAHDYVSALSVAGNFSGTLTVGAASVINTVTVGGNFTGQLLTLGALQRMSVTGNATGLISAANVGTVSVMNATGQVALRIREGAVQRQVEITPSVAGTNPVPVLQLYYESTVPGNATPRIAVRVRNASPAVKYDLSLNAYDVAGDALVSHSSAAKFNLVRLDAVPVGDRKSTRLNSSHT